MAAMQVRVTRDLYEAAQAIAKTQGRSATQQINHWARIGREFEASPRVTSENIFRVLSGKSSYDELSEQSQAVVRAMWEERIATNLAGLTLIGELVEDVSWAEVDTEDALILRDPKSN